MKTCSLCASTMVKEAQACPRCGIAARSPGPRGGRAVRALRPLSVAMLGMATLGALALPVVRSAHGAAPGCEPHSWSDWNLAMERSCVTPAYVCENMTSAKLLQDPTLAGELSEALRAGKAYARDHLDALVGHMRDVYGCDGGAPHAPRSMEPAQRLPPGHPPIPGAPGSTMFEVPDAVTI
jgi:hypothetical protein